MPGFRDLSRLPAGERVLWLLVKGGNFPTRDVRRFACLPVHKDLRYNLLEYIIQLLRDRGALSARRALRLALRTAVGDKVYPWCDDWAWLSLNRRSRQLLVTCGYERSVFS
jgi:hypothetical protein